MAETHPSLPAAAAADESCCAAVMSVNGRRRRLTPSCCCLLVPASEFKDDKVKKQELIDEAEDTLKQMKMEVHGVGNKQQKDAYNAKIANFNTRIAAAKKSLLFSGSSSAAAASSGASTIAAHQQSQAERSQQSLEVLKKARQQLAETEQIGTETVTNLAKQTEQIKGMAEKTRDVNSGLSHSNKLLNKMSQWWRG